MSVGIKASGVASGISSPLQISGTRIWLDASQLALADGANVWPWTDLSGNGLTPAAQGGTLNPPFPIFKTGISPKGKPIARFAANNNSYGLRWGSTWSNPTGVLKDYTLFWSGRWFGPTAQRVISGVNELGSNMFFGYWQGKYDVAHNASGFLTPDVRPAVTTAWRYYSIAGNSVGNTINMYSDGVLILTGGSGAGWNNTLALSGYSSAGNAELSDFDVGELILYNRELTTIERQQVEAYLRAKW
jgi:hypothetical protein